MKFPTGTEYEYSRKTTFEYGTVSHCERKWNMKFARSVVLLKKERKKKAYINYLMHSISFATGRPLSWEDCKCIATAFSFLGHHNNGSNKTWGQHVTARTYTAAFVEAEKCDATASEIKANANTVRMAKQEIKTANSAIGCPKVKNSYSITGNYRSDYSGSVRSLINWRLRSKLQLFCSGNIPERCSLSSFSLHRGSNIRKKQISDTFV